MAIGIIPKQFYVDRRMLEELPPAMPTMFDRLNELYAEREEALLAVLAAGVPANCVALEGPEVKTVDFHSQTLGLGFRFTRSI